MPAGREDMGSVLGPGAGLFPVTENTYTAPNLAIQTSIICNATEGSVLVIGGVSTQPGDLCRIDTITPFKCTKVGRIGGAQGPQGVQGTIIFPVTANVTGPIAGSRVGDLIANVGTGTIVVLGVSLGIGELAKITSTNPIYAVVRDGSLPKGDKGDPGINGTNGMPDPSKNLNITGVWTVPTPTMPS